MSESLLLSDEERRRFVLWIRANIDSNKKLIEQMDDLGVLEVLVKNKKIENAAMTLVLRILETTESQTI